MHKIEIDWGFKSPSMQVLTGIVRIDNISMGIIDPIAVPGFSVRKEINTCGYSGESSMFASCKPLVDTIVYSYFDGMRLARKSHQWFDNSHKHNHKVFLTMFD